MKEFFSILGCLLFHRRWWLPVNIGLRCVRCGRFWL